MIFQAAAAIVFAVMPLVGAALVLRILRLQRNGTRVDARIVGERRELIETTSARNENFFFVIEFTDHHGKRWRNDRLSKEIRLADPIVGGKLPVIFDRRDPRRVAFADPLRRWFWPAVLFAPAVLIGGLTGVQLLWHLLLSR